MRLCSDTVTLRLPYLDDDGFDAYIDYTLTGVSWYKVHLSSVSNEGLLSADQIVLRIPAELPDLVFIPYEAWEELDDKTGYWTLHEGMPVLYEGIESTVISFTDNRRAPHGKHWKVVLK